ncbi:hypothetical protein ACLOJK_038432 [Asimina triloba]
MPDWLGILLNWIHGKKHWRLMSLCQCKKVPVDFILLGGVPGISDEALELADLHCSIPMGGMVDSFNVSVAAGILMHHAVGLPSWLCWQDVVCSWRWAVDALESGVMGSARADAQVWIFGGLWCWIWTGMSPAGWLDLLLIMEARRRPDRGGRRSSPEMEKLRLPAAVVAGVTIWPSKMEEALLARRGALLPSSGTAARRRGWRRRCVGGICRAAAGRWGRRWVVVSLVLGSRHGSEYRALYRPYRIYCSVLFTVANKEDAAIPPIGASPVVGSTTVMGRKMVEDSSAMATAMDEEDRGI